MECLGYSGPAFEKIEDSDQGFSIAGIMPHSWDIEELCLESVSFETTMKDVKDISVAEVIASGHEREPHVLSCGNVVLGSFQQSDKSRRRNSGSSLETGRIGKSPAFQPCARRRRSRLRKPAADLRDTAS